MAVDSNGSTYFAGTFSEEIHFGSIILQCQGNNNMFLAKLNNNGVWMWAKRFTTGPTYTNYNPWERTEKLKIMGENVYLLGYSYYPMIIDGVTFEGNAGNSNFIGPFIARFDANGICNMGVVLNPSYAPLNHYISFKQLVVNSTGIYVSGSWRSPNESLQFGDIIVSGYNDGDTTDYDILYAKVDHQGNLQWVKSIGGPSDEEIMSMCFDSSGNVYMGGEFTSTMIAGNTQLVSNGFKDVFVVKLDQNGNVVWGQKCGGVRDDTIADMHEKNGVIYLTGTYTLQTSFGSLVLEPINTTTSMPGNIYIASINSSGTWSSVNRIGNPMFPQAFVSSIVVDNNSAYILLPRAYAGSSYPLQFGEDFSWYPSNIPINHQSHIIAGLSISTNHWFGIAYAEVINDLYYTKLRADNLSLYLGTPVSDQINFGNINITATTSSCYAIGKISKNEVVENDDDTGSVTIIDRMRIFPNPSVVNSIVNIEFDTRYNYSTSISIYNMKGQLIKSFSNIGKSGILEWNAIDNNGIECPSGVYFMRLCSLDGVTTKKVVLIK